MIDARLQRVMGVPEPFGGVSMLFVGDFNQLGPVKKMFLLDDMINWAEYQQSLQKKIAKQNKKQCKPKRKKRKQAPESHSLVAASSEEMVRVANRRVLQKKKAGRDKSVNTSLYSRYTVRGLVHQGCQVFSQFERYHIRGQVRSKDEKHNKFVKKLANGQTITLKDLDPYEVLSRKDLQDAEWKFAPILVNTNRERMAIVEKQSALFAQLHGTYVFKWRNNLSGWKNKPSDTQQEFHLPDPDWC